MNGYTAITSTDAQDTDAIWIETLAARDAAKHALEYHNTVVLQPIEDKLDHIVPRPDLHFEITAQNGRVARFDVWPNRLDEWGSHPSPIFREKAAEVRDAWLAHLDARQSLGWDVASDESERLCTIQCDRESDLFLMPAPYIGALLWKLDQLFGAEARKPNDYGDAYCAEWINAVMADAHRLLGRHPLVSVSNI